MSLVPGPWLLVRSPFDDTAVRRACVAGDLVRLVRGRYVRRSQWDLLPEAAQAVMRAIAAVSTLTSDAVISHSSAGDLLGIPRLGARPDRVHVIDRSAAQTVINSSTIKHTGLLADSEIDERYGVLVTTARRTVVDIALTSSFRQAVVAIDHSLHVGLVTKAELCAELGARGAVRGCRGAARAIEFADDRADRPGESLSRVVMHECGILVPDLQVPFTAPDGRQAQVDFFWRGSGRVGEFDGRTKYRDSTRWSGLPPHEVVIREKEREDWLRAHPDVRSFVRWSWHDVVTPGRLAFLLAAESRRR